MAILPLKNVLLVNIWLGHRLNESQTLSVVDRNQQDLYLSHF